MMTDSGFAPNPFHGVCTLAACTPNHCRAKLLKGDLIVGCFRSGQPVRVVYVMEVAEVLDLDHYYRDDRFGVKKPLKDGTWEEQAGDNIYFSKDGEWCQDANAQFHQMTPLDPARHKKPVWLKDVRGNRVFISKRFVYFGEKAKRLPPKFVRYLPATQGIKYLKDAPDAFDDFHRWAFSRPRLGRIGSPRTRKASPMRSQSTKGKC